MARRIKRSLAIVVCFLAVLAGIVLVRNSATATADYSRVLGKWLWTQYYQCLESSTNTAGTITSMPESNTVLSSVFKRSGTMYLPSYNLAGGSATSVNCHEIAAGKSGLDGVFANGALSSYKNVTWRNKTSAENLMTNKLKYDPVVSANEVSFRIVAATKTRHQYYSGWLWGDEDYTTTGETGTVTITAKPNSSGKMQYTIDDGFANFFSDLKVDIGSNTLKIYLNNIGLVVGCIADDFSETFTLTDNVQQLFTDITNKLDNRSAVMQCSSSSSNGILTSTTVRTTTYTFSISNDGVVDSTTVTGYEKKSATGASSTARLSVAAVSPYVFSGTDSSQKLAFDTTDYYNLYTYYIQKAVAGSGSVANTVTCNPTSTNNLTPVQFIDNDGKPNKDCYVNFNGVDPSSINVYTQVSGPAIGSITLQAAIDWLNDTNLDGINPNDVANVGNIASGVTGGGGEGTEAGDADTVAACYAGTGVLGWIVCPVLEIIGSATGWMYKNVVEPALEIKTTILFSQGSTNSVYGVWSTFRGFTNILFAIAFVIVILAQLTGIGLSNYNIKKVLPRLIMVVVLVNVSYILCQLAVDVSNILGSSIKTTLTSIEIQGAQQTTFVEMAGLVLNSLGLAGGIGLGVSIALGSSVVISGLQYLVLPIILALVGCLISIIFFFVLLSIRQAGVVILVILAPLAIVCYALPNTKSMFDRWRKLFTSLLVVYPICGLLMGGGQLVGALLLHVGGVTISGETVNASDLGFFYTVSAMLMNVIPFFLIPSMLKGSMALAGNFGAKLSAFGAGVRGGLGRFARNTNAYKEHQFEAARRYDLNRNQTRVGRYNNARGGGLVGRARRALGLNSNLSERQMARVARAQAGIDRSTDETSGAIEAYWKQTGLANDMGQLEAEYRRATEELFENENNFDALERQKAAEALLAATKPGRSILREANEGYINTISGMTAGSDQRMMRERVMRRMSNNLMRTNASDIGKSPLLEEQLKAMQSASASYDTSMTNKIREDAIDTMNTRSLLEMGAPDLREFIRAANAGELSAAHIQKLASLTKRGLADQHLQGLIKEDAAPLLQRMANLSYTSAVGAGGAAEASLASASTDELNRIQSRLSQISGSTDSADVQERASMLSSLSTAMGRALSETDSYSLSAPQASKISQILQDNGVDIADIGTQQAGLADATATQDRLDLITGVDIPHPPRQTLQQQHSTWRRATAADVQSVVGNRGPHAHVPFAADDWIKEENGKLVKLSGAEAAEATLLEKADAEAIIEERQRDFQRQQRRNGSQNGNQNGNP